MATKRRVCIIGGGPSGLLAIHHLTQVDTTGQDIVCFEKQSTYGGQWNFTWRTGTDEFGEPSHSSMYNDMWTNSSKEVLELPGYSYDEHFGRPVPSFLRRENIRDYLGGFCEKFGLQKFFKFNTVVRFVKYDDNTDTFSVTVSDLQKEVTYEETFTHVIVAIGIYSAPYQPDIPGIETFPGILLHSHSLRNFELLNGQKVLSIGSGFSSVDTVLMGKKYGAKEATLSYNKGPLGLDWPAGVQERPQVIKVESGTVHFKDVGTMEPDMIILCTGYKCHFPFMDNELRLRTKPSLYPENLYKGVLFTKGGNSKLFYIGAQISLLSYSWFNLQAMWIARYIDGQLKNERASQNKMAQNMEVWHQQSLVADVKGMVMFQTDYSIDLCKALNIDEDVYKKIGDIILETWDRCVEDPMTYRDGSYRSAYTGTLAAGPETPWLNNREGIPNL